jgi:hypothetical protein
MYPGTSPPLVTLGFPAIAAMLALLLVVATRHAAVARGLEAAAVRRRTALTAVGVGAWLALFAALSLSGVLARFDARPPPLNAMMLLVLGGSVLFARSRAAGDLVEGLPLWALVGFQAFRFPLEVVMHEAARAGVMPVQMSFSGWNFDIVTGLSAIVVAALIARGVAPRALIVAWNVGGALLLVAIVSIAAASTPFFHAFGLDAQNTFIAYFPFVWLPGVMVTSAIVGHLLVLRWLRAHPPTRRVTEDRRSSALP